MTPQSFIAELAAYKLPAVFNPYTEHCPAHDRADGARRRRENLLGFLEAMIEAHVDTIWIARDLGYRGGRRTGVPLTDEVHLGQISRILTGRTFRRATRGPVVAERTAAVVWKVIQEINRPVMLWNVFPFHPHDVDDPFSNRCHTRAEREACKPLLIALLDMLQPRQIIAIGRNAQTALADLGVDSVPVRHPSYGGQSEFMAGLHQLYGIQSPSPAKQLAFFDPA